MARAEIGMVFDRAFPAAAVTDYARRVEAVGLDRLWMIEDCFFTAGVSLAATALAATDRIGVGLGVMPAVARAVPITAMEIATLANIAPGRFFPGIGHGVQEWMGQMGVRPSSPLATLDETISSVRRLLAGDEVTLDGRAVRLDRVRLEQPPSVVPPIVAGVAQAKSLALAGRVADGVILGEGAGPTYVRWALEQAGHPDPFGMVTYTMMSVSSDRRVAYGRLAPFVAGIVAERRPSFTVLPFFDEMLDRVERSGPDALLDMPVDHWREIGAIGTPDDAHAHIEALEGAGVTSINIFPGDDLAVALELIDETAELARRRPRGA